jgi:phage FluMu gp28-like protein
VQLRNGSRVVSLPGTGETVRGFSAPDLIVEDEAAFVEDSFYRAVRPMLAVSGGRLILMSTPYGKRGHFYEAWQEAGSWHRVEVPATECPRITSKFLESERRALGDLWFRQEYKCEFADVIDAVFRMADIERAVTDEVLPLFETPPGGDDVKPLIIVEERSA